MSAARRTVYTCYFVVPHDVLLLDVAGPAEALRCADCYADGAAFDLRYVGPQERIASSVGLTLAGIEPLPEKLPENAILFVSGTRGGEVDRESAPTRETIAWLRRAAPRARALVCICSGALLAAAAGLLHGRACTTHHAHTGDLRGLDPSADVRENRIFVRDESIYTSAGVTSGIDLTLHLIAELAGPICAVKVARNLVVYLRRNGADPQLSPWLEGRNHTHPAVHDAQDALAADPARDWDLPSLAAIAGTSPRHLTRLFRAYAGTNPTEYLHRLRVALARELLTQTTLDIERVAERAGFGSTRQLRRVWRKFHSAPPRAIRP
ncbi:MAG TPA: helix-turn-helix domain-containing protein [Candidatus Dormibacteraeota bacterium]|nr:helix-turn-helix domain-containing protein [Candidatus Dormibacteraeota bacterium]